MGTNPKTDPNFGNGEVGGDRTWGSPIHATTPRGRKITVSYGKKDSKHFGEALVCSGHVDGKTFYGKQGHDHYRPDGRVFADRGAYDGTELSEILAGKISRYSR